MASEKAVMAMLVLLGRAFAGSVDAARADVYAAALEDVNDAQLQAATVLIIRTYTGAFIPPPAVIREACGANDAPPLDVEAVIRRIDRLGRYNPQTGWQAPSVETVGTECGGEIAEAYAAVGGASRLFADGLTTREIAAREFGKELRLANARAERDVLTTGQDRLRLRGGISDDNG